MSTATLLGIQGLALLRGAVDGSDEQIEARLQDVREIAARTGAARSVPPERSVERGYGEWAPTYDQPGNALIQLEESLLLPEIAALPAGQALDGACGTGRASAHLVAAGHEVLGVDATPEMLTVARAKVPQATFLHGQLELLPVDTAGFDVAVCCLALDHFARLTEPVAELARAVRPGGRVIITDVHPFMVALGGQAMYVQQDGEPAFVRCHRHYHEEYLRAFAASGLEVEKLLEVPPNEAWYEMQGDPCGQAPEAFRQAFDGIPATLLWSLVKRQR